MKPSDVVLEAPEAQVFTLTAQDRCDSCGSQAYVTAVMESGELMFCRHHWTEYGPKITQTAVKVVDETERLLDPK